MWQFQLSAILNHNKISHLLWKKTCGVLINSTLVMEMMNKGRHSPRPTSQSRNTDFDGLGCQPFLMDVTPAAHPTLLHCNQNKKTLGCDGTKKIKYIATKKSMIWSLLVGYLLPNKARKSDGSQITDSCFGRTCVLHYFCTEVGGFDCSKVLLITFPIASILRKQFWMRP